ncbi:RNA polymerase subunit sigma-70 [Mucilaginibacter xinganensis]|uniref:RNA polymerase subunit sigma-70 n=2 Tax=Mucilaginibacter xinganensis TaxID=1234841 RepID=A0A223NU89_9SPHI|nr:RNA polymerase subunit sigma-70 [Mucilaginibacter xinganensis]
MPEMDVLISTAKQREQLFIALYKSAFPSVARYISKMGGSFDEAKDVFQDALVIYYEKELAAALAINTNDSAYLLGISKYLWLRKFRENNVHVPLDGIEVTLDIKAEALSESKLMHFLETTGKKCMQLLRSFYYDQLPLADAAKLFGFSGVRSATVQKYKCLEKVRETIKERSLTYEDFLN